MISSELDLVNMIKSARRYFFLRNEELKLKARFYQEFKKISLGVKSLESNLPKVQVPDNIKNRPPEKEPFEPSAVPPKPHIQVKIKDEDDLESQLREIQEKLKSLSK